MKFLIFLAATIFVVQALNADHEWEQFKRNHNKSYRNFAHEYGRFAIFKTNLDKIEQHNELYEQGKSSYTMGVNQFSDMTAEEFQKFLGLSGPRPEIKNAKKYVAPHPIVEDSYVDWRESNAVTEVKDQGQCGSCWAFSTTGGLEGQLALNGGGMQTLSEQCLVDCAREDYGSSGCNGGWMSGALDFIIKNSIPTENQYPYEARDAECRYTLGSSNIRCKSYTEIQGEDKLQSACQSMGPISVAIEVSGNFQSYSSGVYDEASCGHSLNHGVLVAGYGTDGKDYWLVKNSWGAGWGESGYIRMRRNGNNQCGIADYGYCPTL